MKTSLRISLLLSLIGLPAFAQYGAPIVPPPSQATAEAEQRVSEASGTVEQNEERLTTISTRLSELESDISGRVRALYRLQRAGMLPVAGGFDAMLGHLSRVQRLERMVLRDVEERRELRMEESRVQGHLLAARDEREAAQQALASARAAMPPDHGLNTFFDPNYTPRLPVAPVPPRYGLQLRQRPARNFQQQRGNLPMPVMGAGTIADASREDGTGLEFGGAAGRGVRAVADGTVAFARRYGVYGNMVVVDHGQSFFTVYAGLANMNVTVGQSLQAEHRIGDTDGALYFEVRRGTRSLDPRSWIGL